MSENIPLKERRCVPCRRNVPPLSNDQIVQSMKDVEGWALVTVESAGDRIDALRKELKFKNFRSAMSYLRAVEAIAETEAHHPDFCVHYNKVTFTLWTHAIAGLHENDFILAAKIDNLREVFQAAH